jgi:hypothetical protein
MHLRSFTYTVGHAAASTADSLKMVNESSSNIVRQHTAMDEDIRKTPPSELALNVSTAACINTS